MLNASAVVPRAFACSKYVRARVTREEALLEEKRKDGRGRMKNFYLARAPFFLLWEKIKLRIKFQSKKKQGSGKIIVADKKFFDLKSPSSSYYG